MSDEYKALLPVGRFDKGDIVGGIPESQIKALIANGIIQKCDSVQITITKQHSGNAGASQDSLSKSFETSESNQTITEEQVTAEETVCSDNMKGE